MSTSRPACARRRRRLCLLFMLALPSVLGACEDLLAPDAQRRTGPTLSREDRAFFLAQAVLEIPLENLLLLPSAEIVVERDEEWTTFRGVVIETVFDPDTGLSGSLVRGRRYLYAWRPDYRNEVFVMGGGRLPGPMGLPIIEGEPEEMMGYRPQVWALLSARNIRNTSGDAEITPLSTGEDCPWKKMAIEPTHIAADTLLHCVHMEYSVGFRAELRAFSAGWTPVGEAINLRMTRQTVPGIRVSIRCDRSPVAVQIGCGHLAPAPDQP